MLHQWSCFASMIPSIPHAVVDLKVELGETGRNWENSWAWQATKGLQQPEWPDPAWAGVLCSREAWAQDKEGLWSYKNGTELTQKKMQDKTPKGKTQRCAMLRKGERKVLTIKGLGAPSIDAVSCLTSLAFRKMELCTFYAGNWSCVRETSDFIISSF